MLSEYCSFPQVTRARAMFFQRRKRLIVYTERAHFYHRYRIRGIQVRSISDVRGGYCIVFRRVRLTYISGAKSCASSRYAVSQDRH